MTKTPLNRNWPKDVGTIRYSDNGSVRLALDATKTFSVPSLEILPTTVMPGPMYEISVESASATFAGVESCNCGAGGKCSPLVRTAFRFAKHLIPFAYLCEMKERWICVPPLRLTSLYAALSRPFRGRFD